MVPSENLKSAYFKVFEEEFPEDINIARRTLENAYDKTVEIENMCLEVNVLPQMQYAEVQHLYSDFMEEYTNFLDNN